MESKENIIKDIDGRTIEEKTTNVIKWCMHNDVSYKQKSTTSFDSKAVNTVKETKLQKEATKIGKKQSRLCLHKKTTTSKQGLVAESEC